MRRTVMIEVEKDRVPALAATLKKFGFISDGKTTPGGENTIHLVGTLDDDAVEWVRKIEYVINVWSDPGIGTLEN